jgi:hypothetical protein
MEHVRLNLLTADPGLLDKLTTHLEHEVRPRLEEEAGSRNDGSRDSEPTCLRMSAHNRADPVALIAGTRCHPAAPWGSPAECECFEAVYYSAASAIAFIRSKVVRMASSRRLSRSRIRKSSAIRAPKGNRTTSNDSMTSVPL